MEPWKKIALTEEQLQVIYREWGIFYTHKHKLDVATDYYDISLNLKNDPKAFYNRSRCERNIAETDKALKDALAAVECEPESQPYNLEVCDALYQQNEFEDAICNVINRSHKFRGFKLKAFNDRSEVINDNFCASLGKSWGPHILENEKYYHQAFEDKNRKNIIDKRPLWKILREEEQCDVLSVLEEEEELLHPREVARRELAFRNFVQIFMQKAWIDILFMKTIKNHASLLLPECQWSTPQLKEIISSKLNSAMGFLKMLQARNPLYAQRIRRCPNRELCQRLKQERLYRIQNQVHRDMMAILKKSKEKQKIEKLTEYVETVMGDYVVLKTRRVMPWKFQFITEVYNILALAHIDNYLDVPKTTFDHHVNPLQRICILLKMSTGKQMDLKAFKFGDRSSFQDPDIADIPIKIHRKFLNRMEKRLIFAKYSIEKSYLLHEIARSHLRNLRYDECCSVARKSIQEAKKCNSLVWNLLGLLVMCKSHASLYRVEKVNEVLIEAEDVGKLLKDERLTNFLESLALICQHEAESKKSQVKSRQSNYSVKTYSKDGKSTGSFNSDSS